LRGSCGVRGEGTTTPNNQQSWGKASVPARESFETKKETRDKGGSRHRGPAMHVWQEEGQKNKETEEGITLRSRSLDRGRRRGGGGWGGGDRTG